MSMPDRLAVALLGAMLLFLLSPSECVATDYPAITRKVVLAKAAEGYRWSVVEAPVPAPGDRQVVVHVRAVALNRGDLEVLEARGSSDRSGRTIASDAAGTIVAVGRAVREFSAGDRVTTTYFRNWVDGPPTAGKLRDAHGASVDGVFAEYLVIDETAVTHFPGYLGDEEAATLPTAGVTAWTALTARGPLSKDDIVLVQGTGGVSMFATQIAHAAGARVIVTSSSDEKLARVKALGASDGINYRTTPQWSDRVLEITGQHGADVILEVGGKDTVAQSARALAEFGTLSIIGGLTGYGGDLPAVTLVAKSATARGVYVGSRADYRSFAAFLAQHRIHPVVDRVFPFAQLEAAREYMEAGRFVGKIVVRVGE
jgi:NADPH:quinone reductase-like Zn-dependent oxidoreductase